MFGGIWCGNSVHRYDDISKQRCFSKELVSRMDGEIEAKIEKKEFIVEMNFPIVTDAK